MFLGHSGSQWPRVSGRGPSSFPQRPPAEPGGGCALRRLPSLPWQAGTPASSMSRSTGVWPPSGSSWPWHGWRCSSPWAPCFCTGAQDSGCWSGAVASRKGQPLTPQSSPGLRRAPSLHEALHWPNRPPASPAQAICPWGFPLPTTCSPAPGALQMGQRGAAGTGSGQAWFDLHLLPESLPSEVTWKSHRDWIPVARAPSPTRHLRQTKVVVAVLLSRCTACICQDPLCARCSARSGDAVGRILSSMSLQRAVGPRQSTLAA